MSGSDKSEHARPVFFTLDELINLPAVKLRALAQERYHAAPADPAEAIARALYDNGTEIASIDGDDWDTESDFIKQGYRESEAVAVLRALGHPT